MGTSAEIERNHRDFTQDWWTGLQAIKHDLDAFDARFAVSYRRLISMNAWRSLVEQGASEDSVAFFLEAQNDALLSHVQARLGSWRLALKALRSTLENVGFFLYYKDHPVELKQWQQGDHRLGAQEMFAYLASHPSLRGIDLQLSGIVTLKEEYALLSKAVHGSAASFRMTNAAPFPALATADRARLGMWLTREKRLIVGLNQLMLAFYREQLQGTAQMGLREAVGAAIPKGSHSEIKASLGVRLSTE